MCDSRQCARARWQSLKAARDQATCMITSLSFTVLVLELLNTPTNALKDAAVSGEFSGAALATDVERQDHALAPVDRTSVSGHAVLEFLRPRGQDALAC